MNRTIQLILVLGILFSHIATAQSNFVAPNLSGVIVDPVGVPIPKSHIWIFEQSGAEHYTAEPDKDGHFFITLPDGYYFVFIGSPGFVPFSKSIWLRTGKPIKLKVALKIDWENTQT